MKKIIYTSLGVTVLVLLMAGGAWGPPPTVPTLLQELSTQVQELREDIWAIQEQLGEMPTERPTWQIMQSGTDDPVEWVDADNPRFAIYDSGTAEETDDVVLDKETGLVWARDANIDGPKPWVDAVVYCRDLVIGNRKGWRLPTVEELASLVDPSESYPALPIGYDSYFSNVQPGGYWSSTTYEPHTNEAWGVGMYGGGVYNNAKSYNGYVWPVHGGSGPILVPHTPTP